MDDILRPLIFPADSTTCEIFELGVLEKLRLNIKLCVSKLKELCVISCSVERETLDRLESFTIEHRFAWHFSNGILGDKINNNQDVDKIMSILVWMRLIDSYIFQCSGNIIFLPNNRYFESIKGAEISAEQLRSNSIHTSLERSICIDELYGFSFFQGGHVSIITNYFKNIDAVSNIDYRILTDSELDIKKFLDTFSVIEKYSSDYYYWCKNAITTLVPVDEKSLAMVSGSQWETPGLIYLNGNLSVIKTAEMLIHEASHQYFRMIENVCSLSSSQCQDEYYSIVVNKNRPIEKLLLAFHAFSNVLNFMIKAKDRGFNDNTNFINRNIENLKGDLLSLQENISKCDKLTIEGLLLWNVMSQKFILMLQH